MGRPVNEEMKARIEEAAYGLFESVGYDKATYAAIADETGISRNLAQYHFPKKELLAISYMEKILLQVQEELEISDASIIAEPMLLAAVGEGFFNSLLETEGKRTFLQDIIRSRDLTEDVLAFNTQWALSHVESNKAQGSSSKQAERSIIVHMGGFYELLYHSLKTNEPFDDLRAEIEAAVRAFLSSVE